MYKKSLLSRKSREALVKDAVVKHFRKSKKPNKALVCPKCQEVVSRIVVSSECYQFANVDNTGRVIGMAYSSPTVGKTISRSCANCGEDLTKLTKE